MNRPNPLGNKSSNKSTTGIPVGTTLEFYSALGNDNKIVALGKWSAAENAWQFSGKDDAVINWLQGLFAKPLVGAAAAASPNMTANQDSMVFVYHMRDYLMPRQKIVMKIIGAKGIQAK